MRLMELKGLIPLLLILFLLLTACSSVLSSAPSSAPESYNSETAIKNGDVVMKATAPEMGYAYQQDFYTNQILNGKTEITPELMLFFHDYFSKNGNELRLLPEFAFGKAPAWDDLSHYIIFNASEDFVDGSISEEKFDRQVTRFFWPVMYTQKDGTGLIYENGKYTIRYGSDAHGWAIYELTALKNKGKTERGSDKWEAAIRGYFFAELDSDPTEEGYSKNGKAVWTEMKKEENKGLTFWQVQDSLVLKNPGSILELGCEWTVEFAVNDPEGDIYFTYMSCSRSLKDELKHYDHPNE